MATNAKGKIHLRARKTLFLFVWTCFSPDYTDGLAFAIAENETKARIQVEKIYGYSPNHWGTLTIHSLNAPIAFAVSGGG